MLLLGPRQVGKTTLIRESLAPSDSWTLDLSDFAEFQRFLKDHDLFNRQAQARLGEASPDKPVRVFIDEVQRLPRLLDGCQWLYDRHPDRFRFVLTGSSARKLRRAGANLLPGRIVVKHLHPLVWEEMGIGSPDPVVSPFADTRRPGSSPAPECSEFLLRGTMPGILAAPDESRDDLLQSYALTYLKEEIQAEALVRSLDGFSRFLELAAVESGNATNYQNLAQEAGVRLNTVKNYYSILVDTLVAIPLEPYLRNARKRLIAAPRLYFFDTGVRNAAAGLPLDPSMLKVEGGRLFEHFVILELFRRFSYLRPEWRLYYWRTAAGAEVDLVVDTKKGLVPVEIKYAASTRNLHLRGLSAFMDDYGCSKGYVVGNFKAAEKLDRRVTALPWWAL